MNRVYEIIQDTIIQSLEDGPWLPDDFTITIDDESFKELAGSLKFTSSGKRVSENIKSSLQNTGV